MVCKNPVVQWTWGLSLGIRVYSRTIYLVLLDIYIFQFFFRIITKIWMSWKKKRVLICERIRLCYLQSKTKNEGCYKSAVFICVGVSVMPYLLNSWTDFVVVFWSKADVIEIVFRYNLWIFVQAYASSVEIGPAVSKINKQINRQTKILNIVFLL